MKTQSLAMLAAAGLMVLSAPAFASGSSSSNNSFFGFDSGSVALGKMNVIQQLHSQGVNATAVEQWGRYIRAYVRTKNGKTEMELFTPTTLQPVQL